MDYDAEPEAGAKLPKPIASSAWIAPNGAFHYVPDCAHYRVAREVLAPKDAVDAGVHLEKQGWLHLSFGVIMRMRDATNAQLDTLFDALVVYRETGYRYADDLDRSIQSLMEQMDA